MELLIISSPLSSSFIIAFLGRFLGYKGGSLIGVLGISISMFISFILLIREIEGITIILKIKNWFEIGINKTNFEFIYDKDSIIMNNLISIITFIVICYSCWYLNDDPNRNRFLSKLLIFSVTMFILVSSKNFLFTFFGWEGVGIVSYLLINFWYNSPNNNKSAIKALLFNKIGDMSYLMALLLMVLIYNNYDILSVNNFLSLNKEFDPYNYHLWRENILFYLLICIIIASIAKSAQIFLHCWLGDAMAGPTPVSALLHAATMVTAGIFLLLKCKILLNSLDIISLRTFILIIGSLTIIFAGISSLNQYDIKKIIAFSTCAQIGFMFLSISLLKPTYGSLYHLLTHGFFKALLFLSAGLIIHSIYLEQDIRKFGNYIYNFPLFYIFFFVGTIAIIGLLPFSGFYSKDLIIIHSFMLNSLYIPILLLIGSLLSSLYSFKIIYYSFLNQSTLKMKYNKGFTSYFFLYPFILLILGSLFLGYLSRNYLSSPDYLNLDLEFNISNSLINIKFIPFLLPFFAIIIYSFIKKFTPFKYKEIYPFLSIFNRRFFFDTIYNYTFVLPVLSLSYHTFYKFIDRGYLETFGPLGFFRLFYFFPSSYTIKNQNSSNLPYIFYYLFFSLMVFLLIPLLFFPIF